MSDKQFKEWAILELMGHRRLAGLVTEVEIGGASFLRLDVPGDNGDWTATQFYSPSAVYCLTPTTEGMAREVAERDQPEPVHRWELKAIEAPKPGHVDYHDPFMRGEDDGLPFDDELAELEEESSCQCEYCVCCGDAPEGGKCVDCINGAHQG